MYGLTRGTATLIAAGVAGGLIWFASWIGMDSTGEYWGFMGLMAAAGLVMAVSQVLGGWTKWGRPTFSKMVLLLAFLPAFVAVGWVVVAAQPNPNAPRDSTRDWLDQIGLYDNFLEVLMGVAPVLAFGLGLIAGYVLDTTGPRIVERDVYVADEREPLTAEREHVTTVTPGDRAEREPVHAGPYAAPAALDEHEHERERERPGRRFFGR